MTVETGSSIADLDPNAPINSQFAGEGNEHIQRTKLSLTYTFAGSVGDLYDETSGPVTVGPVALNRLPTDVGNIATEIGLNLDNITAPSTIDDLVANTVRSDGPETINQSWSFTGGVDFNTGAVTFTGIVPTIDGIAVATVNDVPSYLERSRLQIVEVTGNYGSSDFGKKLNYTGAGGNTITVNGGIDTDILVITNASSSPSGVLTVTGGASEFFLGDFGSAASFTITGRYRTVGLHKVNGAWQITGDYD